ncbi:MAG TPA: hypothetical protein PLL20_17290 [Phycisphaerae bacterium]|nr:hypothetical protein [Phycisphaerae bacterium]HRR86679.1 hypothetical protein [Phycisphaerae bacterium]
MAILGRRLERAPFWIRWPVKWIVFAAVVFAVCYPHPSLLRRHLRNLKQIDKLPDPTEPMLQPMLRDLDEHLAACGVTTSAPAQWLRQVQVFVNHRIPYAFDWDSWGVVDYLPTLPEIIQQGKEDCDGRAVVAAALIRAKIGEAQLVASSTHMWVSTPLGETMGPMGKPALASSAEGVRIRWTQFVNLTDFATGVALFPLAREAIIVLTAWLLLLPAQIRNLQAFLCLLLLVEAWILFRLSGADPYQPSHWGARWALLHTLAAVVVISLNPRHFQKDTDRTVSP